EEMNAAALVRLQQRRRHLGRRLHADALERKIDLEHAAVDLRLLDADLRAGIGMLTQLEHDPLIGADRLLPRIAPDVEHRNVDPRLRWRSLGERRRCKTCSKHSGEYCAASAVVIPAERAGLRPASEEPESSNPRSLHITPVCGYWVPALHSPSRAGLVWPG